MNKVIVQSLKPFTVTVIDKINRDIPPGQSIMTEEDAEKYKNHVFVVKKLEEVKAEEIKVEVSDPITEFTNEKKEIGNLDFI